MPTRLRTTQSERPVNPAPPWDNTSGVLPKILFATVELSLQGMEVMLADGQLLESNNGSLEVEQGQVVSVTTFHEARDRQWSNRWRVRQPTQTAEAAIEQAEAAVKGVGQRAAARRRSIGEVVQLLAPHSEGDPEIARAMALPELERNRQELLADPLDNTCGRFATPTSRASS